MPVFRTVHSTQPSPEVIARVEEAPAFQAFPVPPGLASELPVPVTATFKAFAHETGSVDGPDAPPAEEGWKAPPSASS
jgi:hypothetical protein